MHPQWNLSFSQTVKLRCKAWFSFIDKCMYIQLLLYLNLPLFTVSIFPPAFHPRSLITISRLAPPPPASWFPRHSRPPHCLLRHPARPHPHSTSSAAPQAPARLVCSTTTTPPPAVSSLYSPMRWAFITSFQIVIKWIIKRLNGQIFPCQVITVSSVPGMDSDWLMGQRGNQNGKVPITYLELLN